VNHDALFKALLKNCSILRAFFGQFIPEAAKFIDFDPIEYVDKERYSLDGRKRTGDLLIKTKFKGEPACFLIHLEHQAQSRPGLAWRMLEYFVLDRRDFGLPVYPVAVLSHAEKPGAGSAPLQVDFPDRRVLEFNFEVIDLARLDARDFVCCRNPAALALSARMSFPRQDRVLLTRDFYVNLAVADLSADERELVLGFYSVYQPLTGEEGLKLSKELAIVKPAEVREKAMQFSNPFIRLGREEGRHDEGAALVIRQLKRRVGALSAAQKDAIRSLNLRKIRVLAVSLLDFQSRADLALWLKRRAS
jgi:hypothetical protein